MAYQSGGRLSREPASGSQRWSFWLTSAAGETSLLRRCGIKMRLPSPDTAPPLPVSSDFCSGLIDCTMLDRGKRLELGRELPPHHRRQIGPTKTAGARVTTHFRERRS